jgi:phage tail P2-like protein
MNSLIPDSASPFLQELMQTSAPLEMIDPSLIETIWDAWSCPAALLPWLAWALSVDQWDDGWDEITKRQTIAQSPEYHEIKGTRAAVETALALTKRSFEINEWYELTPFARRGTASIFVASDVLDDPIQLRARVKSLIVASKPKSRAITIGIGMMAVGPMVLCSGSASASALTIAPYNPSMPEIRDILPMRIGQGTESVLTLQPLGTAA